MNIRLLSICLTVAAPVFLSSCVTSKRPDISEQWLRSVTQKMKNACRFSEQSGLSADVIFNNSVSAQVEAIWDQHGKFSGQLINTLGEDFLSFQIDEFGQFKTNQEVDENESLFQALDLLAQIGSVQTRYLLCSGLYVQESNTKSPVEQEVSERTNRKLSTSQAALHLQSTLSPDEKDAHAVAVRSRVATDGWFFRRTIAEVEWRGKLTNDILIPTEIAISSDIASIKLSFRDFE